MVDQPTGLQADNTMFPSDGSGVEVAAPRRVDEAFEDARQWWTMESRLDAAVPLTSDGDTDTGEVAAQADRWERVETIFGSEAAQRLRLYLGVAEPADDPTPDEQWDAEPPVESAFLADAEEPHLVLDDVRWMDSEPTQPPTTVVGAEAPGEAGGDGGPSETGGAGEGGDGVEMPMQIGPPPKPVEHVAPLEPAAPVEHVVQLTPVPMITAPPVASVASVAAGPSTNQPAQQTPTAPASSVLGSDALVKAASTYGAAPQKRSPASRVGPLLGWILIALMVGIGVGYLVTAIRGG